MLSLSRVFHCYPLFNRPKGRLSNSGEHSKLKLAANHLIGARILILLYKCISAHGVTPLFRDELKLFWIVPTRLPSHPTVGTMKALLRNMSVTENM